MKAFTQLTPREQFLLLGGGAVLLLAGLWLYVVQPMMAERTTQAERIARYLTVLQIASAADTGSPPVLRSPAQNTPLAPRITQSAETAGITLARLDPEGARLRVTVSAARFVDVVSWIATLEAGSGVRALSVELSRLTEPGQVSLRMTVEDAQ